jgi:hypothetical protein
VPDQTLGLDDLFAEIRGLTALPGGPAAGE